MDLICEVKVPKPMDVRFLITFLEVAKTRHFGKTAENLYLTPSAVSARIKQLEEYFNTPLFIRHRNSIQLTSAGEKLVPYAESLAGTLQEAVKSLHSTDVQYIAIGGSPNAWELYLHAALAKINNHFPSLSVRADILTNDQLSRQLHDRTLDLALVTDPLKSDDLEAIVVSNQELALFIGKNNQEESPEDIDKAFDHYVHVEWNTRYRDEIEKHFPQAKHAKLQTGSVRVALDYILAYAGAAVLPVEIAMPLVADGKLLKLSHLKDYRISIQLTYMKEVKQSGLAEFIDYLRHPNEREDA